MVCGLLCFNCYVLYCFYFLSYKVSFNLFLLVELIDISVGGIFNLRGLSLFFNLRWFLLKLGLFISIFYFLRLNCGVSPLCKVLWV